MVTVEMSARMAEIHDKALGQLAAIRLFLGHGDGAQAPEPQKSDK